jgi:hypothetical protein
MQQIVYKIIYDRKWYYILDADLRGFTNKQIKQVELLTDVVLKLLECWNQKQE